VQVRDVMTEATVTDATTDTLRSAAERMWREQTGSLLILDGERLEARDVLGPRRARSASTPPRQGSSNGRVMPSSAFGQGQSRCSGSAVMIAKTRSRSRPTFRPNSAKTSS
jgi:CBS domain-containing protein